VAEDKPTLAVMTPFNGKPATVGNGVMVGLLVQIREQVGRVPAGALAHGGKDPGPVGWRGEGFTAGHFRGPQGSRLVVCCAG
jgi:hypothetical protein